MVHTARLKYTLCLILKYTPRLFSSRKNVESELVHTAVFKLKFKRIWRHVFEVVYI